MVQTDVECLLRAVKNVKTRDKNLIFKAKIMDLESVKSFLFFLKKCAILLLGLFLYRTNICDTLCLWINVISLLALMHLLLAQPTVW